jgi:hypothetical protein
MGCLLKTKTKAPLALSQRVPSMLMLQAPSMTAMEQGAVKMVMICWLGRVLWWLRMLRTRTITISKARIPVQGWKVLLTGQT